MQRAWLLGVFLFLPHAGWTAVVMDLPRISAVPLPERSDPDPLSAPARRWLHDFRNAAPGPVLGLAPHRRAVAARPALEPAAPAVSEVPPAVWEVPQAPAERISLRPAQAVPLIPNPVVEFERLGDELRASVDATPTLDWFLQAVRDPDPKRRAAAAAAFGYPNNFAAIPYVSAVLLRLDEDVSVRVAAAEALGRINDRRAWRFLAQAVADRDAKVRFAAALALAELGSYGDAQLDRVLVADPDWSVRYAAAVAIGRARKPWTVLWLRHAAAADQAWQVRFQAALALGEVGTFPATAALAQPLRDPVPMVRAAAALALGRAAGGASDRLLARALRREADDGVRAVLAWALQRAPGRGL